MKAYTVMQKLHKYQIIPIKHHILHLFGVSVTNLQLLWKLISCLQLLSCSRETSWHFANFSDRHEISTLINIT